MYLQVGLLDLGVLGPDDLAAAVHGHGGLLASQLDEHAALVVADGDVVGALEAAYGPDALEAVVERVVETVGVGVPELDGAVLAAGENERQLGVKRDARDVLRVAVERLHARLVLVVPDLDESVVGARDQVGLVAAVVVVDAVDALVVALEREVGRRGAELPHLDGLVERGRGERVVVLGVEDDLHDVVRVALEDLLARPLVLPVPELDGHVVTGGEDVGLGGMDGYAAYVVRVRLEHVHALERVVVEYADLHVVRAGDDPVLARDELARAHRRLAYLERLDQLLFVLLWQKTTSNDYSTIRVIDSVDYRMKRHDILVSRGSTHARCRCTS